MPEGKRLLEAEIVQVSREHPTLGYKKLAAKLRSFNLIDEFTRECHCIHADRAIKASDVLALLQKAIGEHGAPECLRSDNGPEFIAKAIQRWLKENRIKTRYIDPGCPWQNGYAESFNSRFREECLCLLYTSPSPRDKRQSRMPSSA